MSGLFEKLSVTVTGGTFGLSAYAFWAGQGAPFDLVQLVFRTMTEPYFLVFAAIGGILLMVISLFPAWIAITAAYVAFLMYPEIDAERLLASITGADGAITAKSVLVSQPALYALCMFIAMSFFDVLNMANAYAKSG